MAGSSRRAHDFLRAVTQYSKAAAAQSSSTRQIKLGKVDFDYTPTDFLGGINPRILFDGENTVSQKRYNVMAGYYPLPGQRVALLPIGTTYLIIGCVDTVPQDAKNDTYTAIGSDTWEKPNAARLIRVQVQAGGGAGGGAPLTGAGQTSAGGGGAGGSYGESWLLAAGVDATVTVTVGAGGAGAAGATGGNGGASSFGAFVTASGGNGAGTIAAGTTNAGINGADSTAQTVVGDLAIKGGGGGAGMRLASQGAIGGVGGNSFLGNGARGKAITTGAVPGDLGQGYGGAGSGGVNGPGAGSGNAATAGGDGASGCVIITTYF